MSKAPKLTAADRARLNAKHNLAPIPRQAREPNGRRQRATVAESAEEARKTALQARCRILGTKDGTDEQHAASDALAGSDMGRCIRHIHPKATAPLWDVWQAVCAARSTYRSRILGQTGQPKGASIAFIPDRLETDPSAYVDMRSAEERDHAAKRGDAYWAGLMMRLPTPQHKEALRPAMDEVEGALWRDCAPTHRGKVAVAALVILRAMHGGD